MKEKLSPVYLDDQAVELLGDEARPRLSRIVRSVGKRPDRFDVRWLASPFDATGLTLDREEIIDRTLEPTKAIYLRSEPHRPAPTMQPPAEAPDAVIAQLGGAPHEDETPPDGADLPAEPVKPIFLRALKRKGEAAKAETEEGQESKQAAQDEEASDPKGDEL